MDIASSFRQLAASINKVFLSYETKIQDFSKAKELEDVNVAFQEADEQLKISRDKEVDSRAKIKELQIEVEDLKKMKDDLALEVKTTRNRISNLDSAKKTVEGQVFELNENKQRAYHKQRG